MADLPFYYRLSDTTDREERIEDDAMCAAFREAWPDRVILIEPSSVFPEDGICFGRRKRNELTGAADLPYWQDHGFLSSISRDFKLCDIEEAEAEVARLHGEGKDAFLKATCMKLMVAMVPRGASIYGAIGDMVYSLIDRPDSLLVQEAVDMRHEHRFVVIDGEIVTHSPVQTTLTPHSRGEIFTTRGGKLVPGHAIETLHFSTPSSGSPPIQDLDLTRKMIAHVECLLEKTDRPDLIVDVCELPDGRIETIEFNPMVPGGFGLYGCDPVKIARACGKLAARAAEFQASTGWPQPAGHLEVDEDFLDI